MSKPVIRISVSPTIRQLLNNYGLPAVVVLCAAVLFITFNFIKKDSIAFGLNDKHEKVSIMQEHTLVLRGSRQQCLVGIEVDASNLKTPFTLSAIEFKIKSSEPVLAKQISNAIIWYTGASNSFDTYIQLSDTIKYIDKYAFKVDINKYLRRGKNYFWLAVDIAENAVPGAEIDIDCYGISVEGKYIMPKITDPEGSMKIAGNKPFYSLADGAMNDKNLWNSRRDGKGSAPQSLSDEDISLFCTDGHYIKISEAISTGYVVLEKGAYLKSQNDITCERLIIQSGGIFEQATELNDARQIRSLEVMNGGTFIHANEGAFAGADHRFDPSSNQIFFNYSNKTFVSSPAKWGKVEFDAKRSESVDISAAFRLVQSDMIIKNSGPLTFSYKDTLEIKGNLVLDAGEISGNIGGYSTTWIIGGDLIQNGGKFYDSGSDAEKNSCSNILLSGNFLLKSGTFDFNGGIKSAIYLSSGNRTSTWTQISNDVKLPHVYVEDGRELIIKEKNIRGLGEGSIFEVQENAVLYCGSFNISGEGTFKLSDNASIFIGSPDGINSNKLKGNILTGNRIYSSSANYIYYQGSPAQQTGVFNTTPDERTVNNLIIQKDDARQSVILNSDLTVRGEFREVMGKLDRNAKTLTLIHMSGSSKEERGSNYTEIPKEKKIRKYKN